MPGRLSRLFVALALLAAPACAANQSEESDPSLQGRLEVENRSSYDMDLYVASERGGSVRLGLAPASETTTFRLTPGLLAGAGTIRFQARPVRGGSEPVLSDPYKVRPGELIAWSIPPR
jgi:hypothetical protein